MASREYRATTTRITQSRSGGRATTTQITVFLVVTFAVSWGLDAVILRGPGLEENPLGLPLVFTPGIVGLVASWRFGHRLADIGFRGAAWKAIAAAVLVPFTAATLSFAAVFALGIDELDAPADPLRTFVWLPLGGYLLFGLLALGEEMGWRGFLLARFRDLGARRRYLVVGVIWAVWHFPLILFGSYASSPRPVVSALLFTVDIASLGVFLAWLRERTGSLWPAIAGHASHNVWMVQIYPQLAAKGPWYPYFGGESGILIGILYGVLAFFVLRRDDVGVREENAGR